MSAGSFACFGGFDFAAHFAQLRLDVGELELGVDFFFGLAGDAAAAFDRGERVFVERPAHIVGAAAQGDVVFLRAGEIEERGAKTIFVEKAHVHLQPAFEQHADFIFAVRERLHVSRIFQNVFGHSVDILLAILPGAHRDEQVEVADGFAAAAQRACRRDRLDGVAGLLDEFREAFRVAVAGIHEKTPGGALR